MLAAHARIQSEEAQGIDSSEWWYKIRGKIFETINIVSKNDKCGKYCLTIYNAGELNEDNWINNKSYLNKAKTELELKGYRVEVVKAHDLVLYIVVNW
jgi:hypothetical protein